MELKQSSKFFVKQVHELGELIGFETRNKYQILNEQSQVIAFAAEQQKGIFGFLLRQLLGHWRSFEIHVFNSQRHKIMTVQHPFRWFFQRLEVMDATGRKIGALQQRFSLIRKSFDIENERGITIMEMRSPIFSIWRFPFYRRGRQVANVAKKWSGLFSEVFTDRDTFAVEYDDTTLSEQERQIILAAALFIDLQYFERKARN